MEDGGWKMEDRRWKMEDGWDFRLEDFRMTIDLSMFECGNIFSGYICLMGWSFRKNS